MFRKKQTPASSGRTVRPQRPAQVFSYYASRSSPDAGHARQREAPKSVGPPLGDSLRHWAALAPSFVAGLALVLCLVYVSTLSTRPKIQVVGESRPGSLTTSLSAYEDGAAAVLGESVVNHSKLLINTDEVAQKLQEKYPELGEVAVVLPLAGRRPIIQVRPAQPALLLGTSEEAYVVDENGRIISAASQVESSQKDQLPMLEDESGLSLDVGGYALNQQTVHFVRDVAAQLKAKRQAVQSMTLATTPNELHVRIRGAAYYTKYNLRGDSRVQAGTFIATKNKLERDRVVPKEYLDVRVVGKVFYK